MRTDHGPAIAGTLLLATLAMTPGLARAIEPAGRKPSVEWSAEWPRFRLWEYGSIVLEPANWYLYYHSLPPNQAKWQGHNFFDDTVRGWLRADTTSGRARADRISDVLALGRYVVPFGIDLPVVLLVHRQFGVTWQLLMMDIEAFAVAGFITNVLFYQSGRARPDDRDCALDPSYDQLCGRGNYAGFPAATRRASPPPRASRACITAIYRCTAHPRPTSARAL